MNLPKHKHEYNGPYYAPHSCWTGQHLMYKCPCGATIEQHLGPNKCSDHIRVGRWSKEGSK